MQDASRKGRMNSPTGAHVEKIRAALKKRFADPEYCKKHGAALVARMKTPEWKLAQRNGVRRRFGLPIVDST